MRTDKFDIFKAIFNDNRSKYFHSPSVFASYYSDFLMNTGAVSHSMVPYLDFGFSRQGRGSADAQSPHHIDQ